MDNSSFKNVARDRVNRAVSKPLEKILIVVVILSIIGVSVMWLVPLLKSNTFIEEVMLNVEEESTKESVDSLRKEILEEERSFDFKGLITWIMGTINSLIIIILGIKKVLNIK